MIHVKINGRAFEVPAGTTILEACRSFGIELPTLCHDDRFDASAVCRLCLVRVAGHANLVPACSTPLSDGMTVETATPEVETSRKDFLELLSATHPAAALAASEDTPFQQLLRQYNISPAAAQNSAPSVFRDDAHPYIAVDMSRCILCQRCVRICNEVQGQFVWHLLGRGADTQIAPDGPTLLQSSCVSCGACADTCPTGAIQDKSVLARGSPTQWTRTTCPYCGVGCEMLVGTRGNRIAQIKPASDAVVNHGHLCVKGRYAFDFVHAPDRVTEPMIRRPGGDWEKVSWSDAMTYTAHLLTSVIKSDGADSVGVLGSARGTNEENYVAQKFARVVLGTNNVDCCARVCHAPTASALKAMLGTGAATNSFEDIEHARAFLLCGTNATENHPVVGARIKQAVLRGAKMIVIDPRRTELARYADIHLALKPGTNVPLLNAIACTIFEERLFDQAAVRERISGWDEFSTFIRAFPPEQVSATCGIDAHLIRGAARLYATTKPGMCFHGLGVTEHTQGTEGVMCLVNLALLTGNFGKPGSGVNPLRGQNNVQGSAHMGCEPANLTGYVPIEQARDLFESVWHARIPRNAGLNLMQMLDAANARELKALWSIGYDIALTNADCTTTRAALSKLDLLIVQDLFMNESARQFAHVFLPACSSFEKDGTFMNSERRVQRIRGALQPLGNSRPDWQIICDLAREFGHAEEFSFQSPEEIWNEIRLVWKAGAGISYSRLEHGGLQWPCPSEDHPGTKILHADTFPHGPRAPLKCIPFDPPLEKADGEYPFLLNTGRTLYQFNAGTMTSRTGNSVLRPTDTLDVAPADANRLNLRDGDQVRIRSRYGSSVLPVRVAPCQKPGELFATFHTPAASLNTVTSPHRDKSTLTPDYKVVAVTIEKS